MPTPVTVANANGESLAFTSTLDTGSTVATLIAGEPDAPAMVPLVPSTALRDTDHQRVQVSAYRTDPSGVTYRRTARREDHTTQAITLPEALAPVAFDPRPGRLVATWSALPAYDTATLRRATRDRVHELQLTRGFVEATGLTSATLDVRDVPGLDPAWQLDPLASDRFALAFVHGETSVAAGEPLEGVAP